MFRERLWTTEPPKAFRTVGQESPSRTNARWHAEESKDLLSSESRHQIPDLRFLKLKSPFTPTGPEPNGRKKPIDKGIYLKYILKMKVAKIFQSGGSQAVRIPKECRFEGDSVQCKKVGSALILFPAKGSWDILFEACGEFSAEIFKDRVQPPVTRRESMDL